MNSFCEGESTSEFDGGTSPKEVEGTTEDGEGLTDNRLVSHIGFSYPGTTKYECVLFLFQGASLDTPVKYAFAVIGTFAMAVAVNGVNYVRRTKLREAIKDKTVLRLADFVMYALQVTMAYFLMLIAMSFSVFLFFAVVCGMAIGVLMFVGEKHGDVTHCVPSKSKIMDSDQSSKSSASS